jgi:glucose-6-phosphate-specific signal transduction histidine kinase
MLCIVLHLTTFVLMPFSWRKLVFSLSHNKNPMMVISRNLTFHLAQIWTEIYSEPTPLSVNAVYSLSYFNTLKCGVNAIGVYYLKFTWQTRILKWMLNHIIVETAVKTICTIQRVEILIFLSSYVTLDFFLSTNYQVSCI